MFQSRAGLPRLLKEGAQHISGTDEAVLRNIDAVETLAKCCQTSFGPRGMSKLIVSHIERTFISSDAATITKELEVQHPAAKMLVSAAEMQKSEFGDGANLVISLGGELLSHAAKLLNYGVHISDIIRGYQAGWVKVDQIMESLICETITNADLKNRDVVFKVLRPVVASKVYSHTEHITNLIVDSILSVAPENVKDFNTDNIRVVKITGGNLRESCVVHGMVITKEAATQASSKSDCGVMLLNCGLEMMATESKGTVLLHNAEELLNFTKTEEEQMETLIKGIKDAGVEAVIVAGSISGLALHYLNKYNLMAISSYSKFEFRRIARTLNAVPLTRLGAPIPEEIGKADEIYISELSSNMVTVLTSKDTKVSTIILRGSSITQLDEIERGINDAVSCFKSITKDGRFLPGAGATEIEISYQLKQYSSSVVGLQQYAISRFADALEVVPRILAENAGQKATNTIFKLHASHRDGNKNVGVDIRSAESRVCDAITGNDPSANSDQKQLKSDDESQLIPNATIITSDNNANLNVLDHYLTKKWAVELAVNAVTEILRVDHIIMAKPSGGPKFPNQGHWDAREDEI